MCRKYLVLAATLLFFTSNCFGQSGWVWQNPLPQGNDLYSVKVINGSTAYASGSCGTILKTTNTGQNWTILRTESGYVFYSLYFFDSNTGWGACSMEYNYQLSSVNSKIMKTVDGGVTWVEKHNFSQLQLNSIEFSSIDTGFILCENTSSGFIFKTTDGGNVWSQVYTISNRSFKSMHFFTNFIGLIGMSSGILKTTNGGLNWTEKYSIIPNMGSINAFSFVNQNTGYAVGGEHFYPYSEHQIVLKTTNSGENWISENGVGYNSLSCVDFLNESTGFATSWKQLIGTTNGGQNWIDKGLQDSVWNNSISMKPSFGVIAGNSGIVFTSTNNGAIWTDNFPGIKGLQVIYSIKFLNKNYGFAAAGNHVLKTSNGGMNWLVLNTPAAHSYLNSISLVDSNIIYVADGTDISSDIIKSTNGGTTWSVQNPNITNYLNSVCFINSETGFCCGISAAAKTTNGGINWVPLALTGFFRSISFTDNYTGFLLGTDHSYKTTNGGANWFSLPFTGWAMHFVNSQTGYLAAVNLMIQKTTNGGINWRTQVSFFGTARFNAIHFLNEQTGYAVGEDGFIAKTTNGGNNWLALSSPTDNFLYSVFVTDTNECYAGGNNVTIIKTTTGGNIIGLSNTSGSLPENFQLSQNYPNPFNPQTKVKFDIPKQLFAKLIIYDILGREVATLVNEELKPGTYSFDWDGSNYASGIYFYQLLAGDYVQTKRMVLLK